MLHAAFKRAEYPGVGKEAETDGSEAPSGHVVVTENPEPDEQQAHKHHNERRPAEYGIFIRFHTSFLEAQISANNLESKCRNLFESRLKLRFFGYIAQQVESR